MLPSRTSGFKCDTSGNILHDFDFVRTFCEWSSMYAKYAISIIYSVYIYIVVCMPLAFPICDYELTGPGP